MSNNETKKEGGPVSSGSIYADQYIHTDWWPYFWLRTKISNYKCFWKNQKIARQHTRRATSPYPDHGYRIIAPELKPNGLGRAYAYEIAQLKEHGLLNPNSRNVVIFGQPRHYRKILKNTPSDFADTYRIGLWVTEFDVMPPDWAFALEIVNEIWTPSEFSAVAFAPTGLPVKLVPHAVKVEPGDAFKRSYFGIPENAFVGIAIMDLGTCPDRKNPLAHIKAWQMAFQHDPNAILLMKVRFGKRTNYVKLALIKAIGTHKNIRLLEIDFDHDKMTAFQRMADIYLSLHRSEGYGLNIHEMLELGIPAIVTGYSGNMTYVTRYPNALTVDYKLATYRDCTFHYEGTKLQWAEANLSTVVSLLQHRQMNRECVSNQ